jgi:hypothetical protein
MPRGRKLVVQMVETYREHMEPAFVEKLDAWEMAATAKMALPPVMVYGDDVSHIVTEEGIANLLLCRSAAEREQAIRGVAGYTAVGLARDRSVVENLRDRGIISRPEDLDIDKRVATRDLLAAPSDQGLGARLGRTVPIRRSALETGEANAAAIRASIAPNARLRSMSLREKAKTAVGQIAASYLTNRSCKRKYSGFENRQNGKSPLRISRRHAS